MYSVKWIITSTYLITVNAVNAVGHGENTSGICTPPKTTVLSTSYPHQQMEVYNLPSSKYLMETYLRQYKKLYREVFSCMLANKLCFL